MAGETSIKQLLLQLMDVRTSGVVIGTVMETDPLEIRAENDPKLIITDGNSFVPEHLTDYDVSIEISGVGTKNCTIKGSLQEGDRVLMLSIERGALYILLDRAGD